MATIKYSNLDLTPKVAREGYTLTSSTSPRVFFVTPAGVWECSRDGKETPVALIDCNPKIFAMVAKLLGAAG